MYYIPEEHLPLIPETASGDPYNDTTVSAEFYHYRADACITPDSFKWSVTDGWRKGEARDAN